ncbi:TIM barrel protein, partial [Acidobacteriota bacterium]
MKRALCFSLTFLMFIGILGFAGLNSRVEEEAAIDYQKIRIKKLPFALQCWTYRKFSFYETLTKAKELGIRFLQPYPGQKLDKEGEERFNHELSPDKIKEIRQKLGEMGISLVSYGVVGFDNTEESMKAVFAFARQMGIRTIVTEPKYDDYTLIEKMVKKYNIKVAIHNHPPPTKYARPETVLERIKGLDPRIGVCADTGHWMRTGVDPLQALRMLEGRIVDVHLKDLNEFGKREAYDVPFGSGKANVRDILAELTRQNYRGFIAIEHEKKEDIDNPAPPIVKGLEYVKSVTYYQDYDQILGWNFRSYNKHGWNHYGPGFFELNADTGVLKGNGGMGLFWYSVKKYKDFILELDFKCADKFTNSGIFLRVPEIPFNNDYIYHSFEIQIDDNSKGIHHTAAAYDAEAPTQSASRPSDKICPAR